MFAENRISELQISTLFYRLYLVGGGAPKYLGTAFPVTPNGGLVSCRHVVQVAMQSGESLAVHDAETNTYPKIDKLLFSKAKPGLDMVFMPNALGRRKPEFFPILTPQVLKIGEAVHSFGFFNVGGAGEPEQGYFHGKIVNFTDTAGLAKLTLPYAILEGMSGCPVLTYHNGTKVVGLAYGNRSSRILASEVVDVQDGDKEFKETVNRIVEFGLTYHSAILLEFLMELGVNDFVMSDARHPDMSWVE